MKKTCIIISLMSFTGMMFAQKNPVTVEKVAKKIRNSC